MLISVSGKFIAYLGFLGAHTKLSLPTMFVKIFLNMENSQNSRMIAVLISFVCALVLLQMT